MAPIPDEYLGVKVMNKRIKQGISILLSATLLIIATQLIAQTVDMQADKNTTLEPLQGLQMKQNGLIIKVKSQGCTRAKDFHIDAQKQQGVTQLSIMRHKPDRCRAMPRQVLLVLSFELEANTHYSVRNDFMLR